MKQWDGMCLQQKIIREMKLNVRFIYPVNGIYHRFIFQDLFPADIEMQIMWNKLQVVQENENECNSKKHPCKISTDGK